jgi:glycosyltransferase involved in cell wall biosynthesis
MTVTVVTPVFNGGNFLAHTMASVLGQTFEDFQYVVVDDGSTDGTADLVRQHAALDSRIALIQQPNRGLSAARNTGLRHARPSSEFVVFIDHDDLMRPRALEVLVAALRSTPDALAAHGCTAGADSDGHAVPLIRQDASVRRTIVRPERLWSRRKERRVLDRSEGSSFAALAYVLFIYTPGQVILRRSAVDALGGFDPLLRVAQDYDMWLRVSAVAPLVFVPEVVLDYRQTSRSLSADQATTRREDLHARFKLITSPDVPAATRRLGRHMHRHHEWHRAADRFDLMKMALRNGNIGAAMHEVVRGTRSLSEALLAAVPVEWPYSARVRRYRRSMSES